MMKARYYFASLMAMTIFGACQDENEVVNGSTVKSEVTITAEREEAAGSRTTLTDEFKINWHESDELSVFLGSTANAKFTIHEGGGTGYATFKGNGEIYITGGTDGNTGAFANVAYYPYNENISVSQSNDSYTISTSLPSNQTYREGSFGQNAYHMVAVSETNRDYALTFKNVGSMLMFYVKGTAEITKMELESKTNNLAGACTVTAAYGTNPTLTMTGDVKKITLNCTGEDEEGKKQGVQLSENESTLFVISVPPISGEADDLTLTIYDNSYGYMVYKNALAYSVERNAYYTFGANTAIEYKATAYTQDYVQDEAGNVVIYTAEGMKWFYEQMVNEKNTFKDKTVTLANDIDMTDVEWISKSASSYTNFAGVFDGNDKTISNFTATTSSDGGYATMFNLFSGEIKNLTMDGVTATDNTANGRASALVGYMSAGKLSNVTIKNATVTGYQKVAGLISHPCDTEITIENCNVENTTLKANTAGGGTLWQAGGLFGYASGYKSITVTGCSVKGITIENAATAEDCGESPFYSHPFIGCIDFNKDTDATVTLSNNTISGTNSKTDVLDGCSTDYYAYGKHRGEGKLTITVDGEQAWPLIVATIDGKGYETLTEALADATTGTTIQLAVGEHKLPSESIADGVTIIGTEGTVLAVGGTSISANNVTIKDVTIKNDGKSTTPLKLNGANNTLENCVFLGAAGNGYGVVVCGIGENNTTTLKNCDFSQDDFFKPVFDGWEGLDGGTLLIENCQLTNGFYAIHIDGNSQSGKIVVRNSTIGGFTTNGASLESVSFESCMFEEAAGYCCVNLYTSHSFVNCTFATSEDANNVNNYGLYVGSKAIGDDMVIKNCKMSDGTAITFDNIDVSEGGFVHWDSDAASCNWTINDERITTYSVLPQEIALNNNTITLKKLTSEHGVTISGNGTVVFDNVSITATEGDAITLAEGANVTLQVKKEVSLTGAANGVNVPTGATLTVDGNGKLTAVGSAGSGIGNSTAGTITIKNLTEVTAKGNGNHAFGIGGNGATVTIDNATIAYACGGHIQPVFVNDTSHGKSEPEGGAAIGGATINIEGSTITKVEGGSKAAGIGAQYHQSTKITIKNSTLSDIYGGNSSAGIGGSRVTKHNDHTIEILIEDSQVSATGGQYGAGIGSGYNSYTTDGLISKNEIVIKGNSTINAKGGKYAAGIGTGHHVATLSGSIDASVNIEGTTVGEAVYKNEYTTAQAVGYGVFDPTRINNKTAQENFKIDFTVNGTTIESPIK